MKIVFMIVAALVILGGGGAGAYFYFHQPAQASTGPADPNAKKPEAKKEGEAGEPKFVNLDPLTLPIIDETGVTSNVSIVVALQCSTQEKAASVKKQLPLLTDAYIQDLYGILNKKAALKGGVVQVGMVKERLTQIAKRVLGADMVDDVLLQVVSQRAM